jgi:hypothetical protein
VAQNVAAYENSFGKIESDPAVLKCMVGFDIAATMAVLFVQIHH